MQDDNMTQTTDDASGSTPTDGNVIEPTIGLGTNPSDQTATDSSTPGDDNTPPQDDTQASEPSEASESSSEETSQPEPETDVEESSSDDSSSSGELDSIRASALHDLTPLVDELDQSPEEKYRTLIMMIQASDDQSLVKEAYEAAGRIEDKKAKAEALLTIVNEINYLTGKDKSQSED